MNPPSRGNVERILNSPSYKMAEEDVDFLRRDVCRPLRLQIELLKPEVLQAEHNIHSTIVVFGSARIMPKPQAQRLLDAARERLARNPDNPIWQSDVHIAERTLAKAHYYDEAREFARLVSTLSQTDQERKYVIVTGGGPGIMEAANRGAYEAGAESIGLNIHLPNEQGPNPYVTPELSFRFHYFALRKMHFVMRARALVAFPGGFGTLDEVFNVLTLVQTRVIPRVPVIFYGREFWDRVINFNTLVDEGVVSPDDLNLFHYAETPQEAWDLIVGFYGAP
jgi:uncharacterized protein (TIGR00730 family)